MPHRNVTLLSGDGGIGKSVLVLNLFAHIAARMDWLGFKTMQGPVLYVGAEDDKDEIERRIESTRQGLGVDCGVSFATSTTFTCWRGCVAWVVR